MHANRTTNRSDFVHPVYYPRAVDTSAGNVVETREQPCGRNPIKRGANTTANLTRSRCSLCSFTIHVHTLYAPSVGRWFRSAVGRNPITRETRRGLRLLNPPPTVTMQKIVIFGRRKPIGDRNLHANQPRSPNEGSSISLAPPITKF